jgi:hypothetical protein
VVVGAVIKNVLIVRFLPLPLANKRNPILLRESLDDFLDYAFRLMLSNEMKPSTELPNQRRALYKKESSTHKTFWVIKSYMS